MAKINILLVGGGGGGGNQTSSGYGGGGGGGAGGVKEFINNIISLSSYNIVVGTGSINNGGTSVFHLKQALGGGAGGIGGQSNGYPGAGSAGGSGGGAGGCFTNYRYGGGGAGTLGQGHAGGSGYGQGTYAGAGGGGAGGAGTPPSSNASGGVGRISSVSGISIYYGGGGGGGSGYSNLAGGGIGGLGGGGNGQNNGVNGLGGGGGGRFGLRTSGGSGIVIISYANNGSDGISPTLTTGGSISIVGGMRIHTFTTSGTFTPVYITAPIISNIPDIHLINNETSSLDLSTYVTSTGTPIISYGLTGVLPTGISFNTSTGIVSGFSTQTGIYNLILDSTNIIGTTTKTFNLIINSPTVPVMGIIADIVINSWDNINKDFSLDVTQTNQDPILSYTLTGTLILGLNFNTTTGILSGNPTQVGTYGFGIQATDKDGISNTSNFNIIINKAKENYGEPGFFDLIANGFN